MSGFGLGTVKANEITVFGDINADGDIVGDGDTNVTGINNLAGTLTTASQPNITSIGSISGLTLVGDLNANGNIVGDSATNVTGIDKIFVEDGTTGDPSFSFTSTTDTGLSLEFTSEETTMTFGKCEQYEGTASQTIIGITNATFNEVITSVTINGQQLLIASPGATQTFYVGLSSAVWESGGGTNGAISRIRLSFTSGNSGNNRQAVRNALRTALIAGGATPPGGSGPYTFANNVSYNIKITAPMNLGTTPDGWVVAEDGTITTSVSPLSSPASTASYFILHDTADIPYYVWLQEIGGSFSDPTPGLPAVSVEAQLLSDPDPSLSVGDPVKDAINGIAGTPFTATTGATGANHTQVDIAVNQSGNVIDTDTSNMTNINLDPATNSGSGTLVDITQGLDPIVRISTGGTESLKVSEAGIIVSADGATGAPSISFSGDSGTGLFHPAAEELAFTSDGVEKVRMNGLGVEGWRQIDSVTMSNSRASFIQKLIGFKHYKIILSITGTNGGGGAWLRFYDGTHENADGTDYVRQGRFITNATSTYQAFSNNGNSSIMRLWHADSDQPGALEINLINFNDPNIDNKRTFWNGSFAVEHLPIMGSGRFNITLFTDGLEIGEALDGTAILYGYGPK